MGLSKTITTKATCDRCGHEDTADNSYGPKGWQVIDANFASQDPLNTDMYLCPKCLKGLIDYMQPKKQEKK